MLFSVWPGDQREHAALHLVSPCASIQFSSKTSDRQPGKAAVVWYLGASGAGDVAKPLSVTHSRALNCCDISITTT